MAGDAWIQGALQHVRESGQYRSLDRRVITGRQGRSVVVNGRELVCFASNDYLGLAGSDAVVNAGIAAMQQAGNGSGASRHITGNMAAHGDLERSLASFTGAEGAVLFGSGMLANLGIISTLVGPGDAVFSDELNHASIIDGCRLSKAQVHVYRHNDIEHLAELLRVHQAPRRLIVTDAIFSMDGDLARLQDLADLAVHHDVMLMVDEAHAFGVLGDGSGLCNALGIADAVTVRMATLGKALGSYGAFAFGGRQVIELLVNRARSVIFSTALPPAASASAIAALQEIRAGTRMDRLHELQGLMMRELKARSLTSFLPAPLREVSTLPSPIVPLIVGDNMVCLRLAQRLTDAGFLVVGIRPPTVPVGTARLRITLNALHTNDDVIALCGALQRELRVGQPELAAP